ncbi:hypothetical protein YY92_08325 [Campylobacter fetus]|uniref:Rha family transcriptional regulator n=1 Tax=Campylobacter fetus TaxID=196 RepID=UPI0011C7608A|nr:Rha family transcriptional regulator [Campylobacter fetus]EAJ1232606.1 hypothetical protein [Campylobacter fetus]EAK0414715.1 hypothetical protein [Campylobacter fetus]TXF09169.1 Rha family transcriptional regulator [Campylobacter fetus subsp. fetus]
MSSLININDVSVKFEVVGDNIFADSLQIGDVFEKRHDHILRLIGNLSDDEFKSANFEATSYLDKKGELRPAYNLTKDGFCLLVMGFTGAKAYKWKVEFIRAFNMMFDELRRLKSQEQVNQISSLKAIAISKAKHHEYQINGYKSQLVKHNEQIKLLKAKLTIAEDRAKNPDIKGNDELQKRLLWLFKRSLADGVIYAINSSRDKIINDALKRAGNEFMGNLHLLK